MLAASTCSRWQMNDPDNHHWNIPAIITAAGATGIAVLAFGRSVCNSMTAIATAISNAFKVLSTGLARLNAQDEKIATMDRTIESLKQQNETQQGEINTLKQQLADSEGARLLLEADKLKLQVELAAKKEELLEREMLIARLERERNALLSHTDALDTQKKVDDVADAMPKTL